MRTTVILFFSAVAFALPLAAEADGNVPSLVLGNTLRSTKGRYGHAETLVDASPERVKRVMVDYGHYKELHPKFRSARVIAKEGDATDLYMRLPVKIGPVTIPQYEVMRFGPARALPGGGWAVEARGLEGDMKEGHIAISVRPAGGRSILSVDLLLVPNLPAPQSLVDEELRDGAVDLADGMRDRAQSP
jgi:hypothetical protein